MVKQKEKELPDKIWRALYVIGVLIIIISIISGGYIINEFGFVEIETRFGSRTQTNIVGTASGFAVIFQGVIAGVLMMAFSRLGESVNRIEAKMNEDN